MPYPLVHNSIGKPFIELQSVDSTNNYARRLIHEGMAEHGMAIFAHEQLAGKGQRGKDWSTEKNANLILSIVINALPLQLSKQFGLIACISVAVHEFFAKYAGKNTRIKWPNDLYYQDKKAGGILIENIISMQSVAGDRESVVGSWKWSIVGIGININQTSFSSEIQNPFSLKQITNQDFNIIPLTKELCSIINNYFQQLTIGGFDDIYAKYLAFLYKKNETVRLKKDNRIFEATIKTVSSSGRLVVQHAIEEEFQFGEVEWMI